MTERARITIDLSEKGESGETNVRQYVFDEHGNTGSMEFWVDIINRLLVAMSFCNSVEISEEGE